MVWIGCWSGGLEYQVFDRNSMNADIYCETVKTYHEQLRARGFTEEELSNYILQQDNASSHTG